MKKEILPDYDFTAYMDMKQFGMFMKSAKKCEIWVGAGCNGFIYDRILFMLIEK